MTANKKIDAITVGKYFLKKAAEEGKPITNKKLQKLVYYAQVWSVTIFDERLFNEKIQAWVHGPAIPVLYKEYKKFESNPIEIDTSNLSFEFTEDQSKLLDNIWVVYGKYDAEYLEALTHSELPWQDARGNLAANESSTKEIDLEKAKEFYAAKLAKA